MCGSKVRPFLYIYLFSLVLFLAACRQEVPSPTTSSLPGSQPSDLPPTQTSTPQPTPTLVPDLILLVASPDSDSGIVSMVSAELSERSTQNTLRFETRTTLVETDLSKDVRLVVAVAPDPGLATIVPIFPSIQFLAIGIPGLQPAPNLSLIAPTGIRYDQAGFLAGYLSAVITKDWRVAVMSRSDTSSELGAKNAFMNGVIFFCGLCRPVYPPFHEYPLFVELPGAASQSDQESAADFLVDRGIKTIYASPGVGNESLLAYLANTGALLIGHTSPPTGLENQWVATIQLDLAGAINLVWDALLNDQGESVTELPIILTHVNPNLLSPGRQNLVEKMLLDLTSGYIDTGVDSLTGQPR